MQRSVKWILPFTVLALFAAGCGSKEKVQEQTAAPAPAKVLPTTLEEAVNSPYRTAENKVRDPHRHPLETLTFFGVTPEMTVIEITPGAGWYAEILAPFLAPKGQYIAATFPSNPENAYFNNLNMKFAGWLNQHPEVLEKTKLTTFAPPNQVEISPPGTADRVLTFRNIHNWMANGVEKDAFKSFYRALKPGGILGIVEHRADPKSKRDPKAKSGYVREKDVIRLAESVGFKLDAKSEINANPKDTKDYPEGVWTLPPSLRLKDQDREKYMAIGESDRMTLRFIKSAAKATR